MPNNDKSSPDTSVSSEAPGSSPAQPAAEASRLDTALSELTVRDLLELIRAEGRSLELSEGLSDEEALGLESVMATVADSDRLALDAWESARAAVEVVGPSPIDVQICFLQGLVAYADEAERFLEDPVAYAREAGVVLDPDLVRDIIDAVVFGAELNDRLADRVSPGALKDIAYMRQHPNACVMAGAASVVANSSDAKKVMNDPAASDALAKMKGLDGNGIRLPGGRVLAKPTGVAASVAAAAVVAATYAVTSSSVVFAEAAAKRAGAKTSNFSALRGALLKKKP